VISAETGMIIGILEEYIPTGVLSQLWQLEEEGIEALTERRKKWGLKFGRWLIYFISVDL
jgi:hypothetical protein